MLKQFNLSPKFGDDEKKDERKKESGFRRRRKMCGNGALWKREGRLDKEILFHKGWKKGHIVENLKVSRNVKALPSLFPQFPQQ